MKRSVLAKSFLSFLIISSCFFSQSLVATVGAVLPGQPLWGITKRIGETVDVIESKICNLDISTAECQVSGLDDITSQLDVIESKIDALSACDPTPISADDIVAGAITLSMSGNYCLTEDVTANVSVEGDCISLDLNRRCVTGTLSISGDDSEVKNGNLTPPAPTGAPVDPALNILAASDRSRVVDVQIRNVDTSADGIAGRDGIEIHGNDTQILGCSVFAGAGGDSTLTDGGDGGDGMVIGSSSNNVVVRNCLFTSGDGGTTTAITSNGGNAGRGILIESDATETEINDCTVLATGNGGGGGATSGNGGNGGDGVKIESTAIDTVLRNCTIRNTGSGSAIGGGSSGVDGKAVDDDVIIVANASMVYSNFAHNIANSIKFDLVASGFEHGVPMPNPPTDSVINSFANVYVS